MKHLNKIKAIGFGVLVPFAGSLYAQLSTQQLNGGINTITTSVPLLLITPDSRAGGMADCGVASSPDANSVHWNAAKLAFAEKKLALGVSYTPWLRQLVNDINLAYLSGYYKMDKNSAVAGSLRYFSLGTITFTDIVGNTIGNFRPNEFALDAAYARKLSKNFSGGMAMRFIYSNLTNGLTLTGGTQTHAGTSFAVDLSGYYKSNKIESGGKASYFSFGFNISNMGTKIAYTSSGQKDFIPTNLKLGVCYQINLDEYNTFNILFDVNKLLVPSPPYYVTGTTQIAAGKNPNVSVAQGIVQSFYDAPGGGKEELKEYNPSIGLEYWYDKQFAVRTGFFYEDRTKGNRQYLTLGAGVKYNVFGLDFAYLIPIRQNNPLQNTLRFTLLFDFDAFKSQNAADTPK
ncbi:MAG: type IX secretion system outer membrane channel protein PorV [Bacteroidia bacterium]|nr:type IX secretion system outer membrane channel protein PorV [Bacteroidia bacterium]